MGFMAYGGPAMMGFIKREIVFKHRLLSEEDFNEGIALVNVIPGATNSQMIAYTGYKLKKSRGAFIAFTAFVIPAFLEMLFFTVVYKTTGNLGMFMQIFNSLAAVVTAIILNTVVMFGSKIIKEWRLDILALITIALLFFKFNVIFILLIVVGLTFLLFFINKRFWPFAASENINNKKLHKDGSQEKDRNIRVGAEKDISEGRGISSGVKSNNHNYCSENVNNINLSGNNCDYRSETGENIKLPVNNPAQKKYHKLKIKINPESFFKTYMFFFISVFLVVAALAAGFFLKKDLFLAGLTLTKASILGFGGAIPMLTIIQYDMVNVLKIFSQKQIVDALVLGQITPGPIMITSTFIGYYIYGFIGALLCTVVAFYPSFAIFSLVAPKYESVKNNKYVKLVVKGIMGMFVGMLLFFLYSVGKEAIKGYISAIIALLSFIAIRLKVREIYVIAAAAIIGVVLYFFNIKIV